MELEILTYSVTPSLLLLVMVLEFFVSVIIFRYSTLLSSLFFTLIINVTQIDSHLLRFVVCARKYTH